MHPFLFYVLLICSEVNFSLDNRQLLSVVNSVRVGLGAAAQQLTKCLHGHHRYESQKDREVSSVAQMLILVSYKVFSLKYDDVASAKLCVSVIQLKNSHPYQTVIEFSHACRHCLIMLSVFF